jgi:hypothetical protein
MNRGGANSVAVTPSFIASSTPCALVAIAQCPDPSTLVESRAASSPRSSVLRRQPAARRTQLQSAINLRCNLTTSPLGNYGNCGDLHISYNETAERDVRDAGPEFVVDHDLAARVDCDARRVELEIVRVWPAADRDEHVRAKVTLIGKSGRTKGVPRTSLCSWLVECDVVEMSSGVRCLGCVPPHDSLVSPTPSSNGIQLFVASS